MELPAPAILVLGGAFNPVHCGHVAALRAAKAHVEATLPYQVVAAYLACAPESYVAKKYKGRTIPESARLEMCNLVAQQSGGFLREMSKAYSSVGDCGKKMVFTHHAPGTKVLVVCGADKARRRAKEDHIYVARSCDEAGEPGGAELVLAPQATLHASATAVRAALSSGPLPEAARGLVQDGVLPAVVGQYIAGHPEAFAKAIGERPVAEVKAPRQPAQPVVPPPQEEPQPQRRRRWGAAKPDAAKPASKILRRQQAYVLDMETGDPDDVLTLLLLGAHPSVELRAVTCTPGSEEQVSLIRWLLAEMGLGGVRVGAQDWPSNFDKGGVMGQFYKSFGRLKTRKQDCEPADRVLRACCDESTTLVTGAPLHNLGAALKHRDFRVGRWVAQGGFAGEGVVPRELQMSKFIGLATCPTWNFCGNIKAAQDALESPAIGRKVLVSKNVCHRAVYDERLHEAFGAAKRVAQAAAGDEAAPRRAALELLHGAMDDYLLRKPGGKKLHDPLALAVALDESVCQLAEVRLFCEQRRAWGSKLAPGSGTWISVDYDEDRFHAVLLCQDMS